MDDLVKRLRKKVEVQGHQDGVPCWMWQEIPLQVEAADKIDRLTAELAEARDLARRAAQMLIEEIGAPGPENVDETATRAVATITRLTAELAEMKERADGELPSYTEQRCAVENAKLEDQLAEALGDWQWMLDALMSGRLWFDRRWHQWRVDGYSYDVDRFDLVRAAIDAGEGEVTS
jgi:FtsZ-binding cell division protein ZapB